MEAITRAARPIRHECRMANCSIAAVRWAAPNPPGTTFSDQYRSVCPRPYVPLGLLDTHPWTSKARSNDWHDPRLRLSSSDSCDAVKRHGS
jgi:hypothetical protein